MSLAGGRGQDQGVTYLMSGRLGLEPGRPYSEVQCIMGNGHMGLPAPDRQNDRHTLQKTLLPATPSAGGNNDARDKWFLKRKRRSTTIKFSWSISWLSW